MDTYLIAVAGGKGLRMGGDIPKQFLPINGKPVLMRTLEAFYAYDKAIHLIVVLPVDQQDYWKHLCQEYAFTLPHQIADGGESKERAGFSGGRRCFGGGARRSTSFCVT